MIEEQMGVVDSSAVLAAAYNGQWLPAQTVAMILSERWLINIMPTALLVATLIIADVLATLSPRSLAQSRLNLKCSSVKVSHIIWHHQIDVLNSHLEAFALETVRQAQPWCGSSLKTWLLQQGKSSRAIIDIAMLSSCSVSSNRYSGQFSLCY